MVKNPPANAGDARDSGSISGLGRSPREGNGYPLQYSCLENCIDRGALWATVHGIAKSWVQLNNSAERQTMMYTEHLPLCSPVHGEGNGTPLQYSCLGNPMDRGAW